MFDKGQFTCYLIIDLKKAFDAVTYNILLSKHESCGFRGVVNDWFRSYLIGRRQYTIVNVYISDVSQTLCGVPQDSVLGPLLFLLYVNDLYKSSNKIHFYLFADDTSQAQTFCSPSCTSHLIPLFNLALSELWYLRLGSGC